MLKSPFFRRLFLPYLAIILSTTAAVGLLAAERLRAAYLDRTQAELRSGCALAAELMAEPFRREQFDVLQEWAVRLGLSLNCRVTVIQADGRVVADSQAEASHMDNHSHRPEVLQAVEEGEGTSVRTSDTIHRAMLYHARRSKSGGRTWFVRMAVPLIALDTHLRGFYSTLAGAGLLAAAAGGAVCYLLARRQVAPVLEVTRFAEALSQGQFDQRVAPSGTGEMASLGNALNLMADSLTRLLTQTASDQAEIRAVMSSMSEGILAVDARHRILLCNAAAGDLLGFDARGMEGRSLSKAVTDEEILQAAIDALAAGTRRTIQRQPVEGRYLEVTLSPFSLPQTGTGLIIVIHDASQSMQYQELRKEFVANVSHELRTPLTAIKGFTETLRDGAISDPVRGPRFLATIEKHVDQLTNLVADLLDLSRLENYPELPRRVEVDPLGVAQRSVELLSPAAAKKQQIVRFSAGDDIPTVPGDPDDLERAVTNLVDNAVKYTPAGGRIDVRVQAEDGFVVIEIADNGIGIAEDELPRIFERFYRVDRSRSRDMGGTGLGLSIVKHVANAHRGTVEVQSQPGKGTTFRLKIRGYR